MRLVAAGFEALEGPAVDEHGDLLFSDLRAGGVHRLDGDGRREVVLPERKAIGGICLHASGGLVVSGADLRHVVDAARPRVLLDLDDVPRRTGTVPVSFNDIAADRAGRLYAGVLRRDAAGDPVPGELLLVVAERDHVVVHDNLHPNGIGLSPDGSRLYVADTFGRRLLVFAVGPRELPVAIAEISTTDVPGLPDGLAVDAEGCVWVAFYRGGCVARFEPGGRLVRRVSVPALKPLSVCLAGREQAVLYVVTATRHPGSDETGAIYALDVDVPAAPLDRVAI